MGLSTIFLINHLALSGLCSQYHTGHIQFVRLSFLISISGWVYQGSKVSYLYNVFPLLLWNVFLDCKFNTETSLTTTRSCSFKVVGAVSSQRYLSISWHWNQVGHRYAEAKNCSTNTDSFNGRGRNGKWTYWAECSFSVWRSVMSSQVLLVSINV